ncbi:phosphoribosylanthranilate isomerase [Pseudomonas syringae pv. aptata]|jgi:phosphoribosylanthranilate isomerase|uniref:N-(5'-phosphoribosyl)anthranilate isomerase n=5 Tax=Pseudomonas syringae group TaxID=136849 RepID=F3FQR0_PSESX|nr:MULTISPECIES: phosphoribosylanthranilate isomerase [Pseudomonas]EGH32552.1 N-(5'-phosphoribosyl)anthranilate isomerase [Pseudomonas syringae pv. japonica str. M301072]AVX23868.1 phosphoribosylanthranilate isomerase [Pseudomonas syringae pv. atrofaciens]AZG85822.1 phosphoribosylanthranilate isomerase [Pseudomonas syringae pv. pisi str. PP1]EPF65786.1 N-(5'-phosphoribosyl)anthranilate isomerase [Pseudomonas syringae pv. syringae SM]KMY03195.1 N-(5'-phosphoribosyl)anthranilate isomerase [Pseud
MSAVRSKICGITRIEDALAAAEAGADAIGLVFYPKSPRAVTVLQARAIIAALPPFITTVGLFVNASRCELNETLDAVALDMLQFHGDETPEECDGYHRPYIKALRVKAGDDIAGVCRTYRNARGVLLDTYVEGVPGGTGETFDWALIPDDLDKPVILAGGLTSANVAQAIAQVRPYAVDVSGGVEKSKGIKDREKIRAFMSAVHGT